VIDIDCRSAVPALDQLLKELREAMGLPRPPAASPHTNIVVDGVEVVLAAEPYADTGELQVCVDLGEIPEPKARHAYRAMLESNLLVGGLNVGVMTLHPDAQRGSLVLRLPLTPELRGDALADAVRHSVELSKSWRSFIERLPATRSPRLHHAAGHH